MQGKLRRALQVSVITAGVFASVVVPAQSSSASTGVSIQDRYTGLCMGVASKTGNGAPVIQWPCNGASDEEWTLTSTTANDGSLAYTIKNTFSGKCIGVGSDVSAGARLLQYTCNDAIDEKWWVSDNVVYQWFLENVYSGKYAEPSGPTQGDIVIQRNYVSDDVAQAWFIGSV